MTRNNKNFANKYLEMGKQGTNLDLEANQLILDEVKYN